MLFQLLNKSVVVKKMIFVPRKLDKSKLPTRCNMMQHLLFLRSRNSNRSVGFSKCYSEAIKDILEIWKNAQIPTKGRQVVWKLLIQLTTEYRNVSKNPLKYKEDEWNKIFCVSACKCPIKLRLPCQCPADKQVPLHVRKFYADQIGQRLLSLGSESDQNSGPSNCSSTLSEVSGGYSSHISERFVPHYSDQHTETSSSDEDTVMQPDVGVSKISLPTFSAALDRAGVSNRFGALLATSLAKDLNIPGLIFDQHKISRERIKARADCLEAIKCNDLLRCISFDGKREKTLCQVVVNGSPRNIKKMEEHITMVKEPNSCYIGYLTSVDGTGAGIALEIINFLKEQKISVQHLVAINCDGTRTNTGKHKGTVCTIERHLQRPLQWFVCLFHFNELPFTALVKHFLGKANGPHNWPGVIGQTLLGCEDIPVVDNFEPIRMGQMPENIEGWNLRGDQLYLYNMVRAVNDGVCSEKLANIKPGPLNLSRWLTTASRILRLYVTQPVASAELKNLALFVMKVYGPFWFLVKSQPQGINGSRHLLKYIQWTRELPSDMQEIVNRSVQINGYFAHHENILLSMITDDNKAVRKEGYDIIFKSRSQPSAQIRQYNIPIINFNCNTLKDMIDWNKVPDPTEPPCIQFYSQQHLMDLYESDDIVEIPEYPCHSQNTERYVQIVSQSCLSVIDKNRPAHIASKIESRKRYTKLNSRKDLL